MPVQSEEARSGNDKQVFPNEILLRIAEHMCPEPWHTGDSLRDLLVLCRTAPVFHQFALPKLYNKVVVGWSNIVKFLGPLSGHEGKKDLIRSVQFINTESARWSLPRPTAPAGLSDEGKKAVIRAAEFLKTKSAFNTESDWRTLPTAEELSVPTPTSGMSDEFLGPLTFTSDLVQVRRDLNHRIIFGKGAGSTDAWITLLLSHCHRIEEFEFTGVGGDSRRWPYLNHVLGHCRSPDWRYSRFRNLSTIRLQTDTIGNLIRLLPEFPYQTAGNVIGPFSEFPYQTELYVDGVVLHRTWDPVEGRRATRLEFGPSYGRERDGALSNLLGLCQGLQELRISLSPYKWTAEDSYQLLERIDEGLPPGVTDSLYTIELDVPVKTIDMPWKTNLLQKYKSLTDLEVPGAILAELNFIPIDQQLRRLTIFIADGSLSTQCTVPRAIIRVLKLQKTPLVEMKILGEPWIEDVRWLKDVVLACKERGIPLSYGEGPVHPLPAESDSNREDESH